MALSMTVRLLMKNKILKSELILKTLPKTNTIFILADEYIRAVRDIKYRISYLEASELMQFPLKSFQKFPKPTLKNIIDESFNLMKEQGKVKSTSVYNNLIQSYTEYDIGFDINHLLDEMTKNQIEFNNDTHTNIIKYYCRYGKMNDLELHLEKMKSNNVYLQTRCKWEIVAGYIISGQPDKSKAFIKENELDENNSNILMSESRGYATIGDINNVTKILNKIKEKKVPYPPEYYSVLYRLLVEANVPESNLGEIFDLMKSVAVENSSTIYNTISRLNHNGHFNNSLYLVEKLVDIIDDRLAITLMASFNKPNCPFDIYKKVLICLMVRAKNIFGQTNMFHYMDFDDAFEFGGKVINEKNGELICVSLINKAITDKSLNSIKKSLKITFDNLQWNQINMILQFGFIRSILDSGMASNHQEILNLLPGYGTKLLPIILISSLSRGDFDEFNRLRIENEHLKNISFATKWRLLADEILKHLSMNDINRLAEEASKVFNAESVNCILSELISKKIIEFSRKGDLDGIQGAVELSKNLNVVLRQPNINNLIRSSTDHLEYFKSLLSESKLAEVKEVN